MTVPILLKNKTQTSTILCELRIMWYVQLFIVLLLWGLLGSVHAKHQGQQLFSPDFSSDPHPPGLVINGNVHNCHLATLDATQATAQVCFHETSQNVQTMNAYRYEQHFNTIETGSTWCFECDTRGSCIDPSFFRTAKLHPKTDVAEAMFCQLPNGKTKLRTYNKYITPSETELSRDFVNLRGCSVSENYKPAFGDIDNDGVVDIYCYNLYLAGDGTETMPSYYRRGVSDGNSFYFEDIQRWFPTQKWSTFANNGEHVTFATGHVELADVNGDGRLEARVASRNFRQKRDCTRLYVTLKVGGGNDLIPFTSMPTHDVNNCGIVDKFVDVNKDGLVDLVRSHPGYVTVYFSTGSGNLRHDIDPPYCSGHFGIAQLDSNRDNALDLLCYATPSGNQYAHYNQAQNCEWSGTLCEHGLCPWFEPTQELAFKQSWFKPPSQFDWNMYLGNDLAVKATMEGNKLVLRPRFTPVSNQLSTISRFGRIDSFGANQPIGLQNVQTDAVRILSCDDPVQVHHLEPLNLEPDEAPVGTEVEITLVADWQEFYSLMPNLYWQSVTTTKRPSPTQKLTFQVPFLVQHNVECLNKNNDGVPGVSFRYRLKGDTEFRDAEQVTDSLGTANLQLTLPNHQASTATIELKALKTSGGTFQHDIQHCPSETCVGDMAEIVVTHLSTPSGTTQFIDHSSNTLSGKVSTVLGSGECGIPGVRISSRNVGTSTVISEVYTDEDGNYELDVVISPDKFVVVDLEYHDFKFIVGPGTGSSIADMLVSVGIVVGANTVYNDINFVNDLKRNLDLSVGLTRCGYPLGEFTATLSFSRCPTVTHEIYGELSDSVQQLQLPADSYDINLEFSTVAGEYTTEQVNTRTAQMVFNDPDLASVNLTLNGVEKIFAFHVIPTLEIGLESTPGALTPPPDACTGDDRYVSELPGNTKNYLSFKLVEEVDGQKCEKLDPNLMLRIASHLGSPFDPCDWTNRDTETKGGCVVKVNEDNKVVVPLITGQPELIREGDTVKNVLKLVEVNVYNPYLWHESDLASNGELYLGEPKFLILGIESINSNAIISVPISVPITFLYSPPTAPNSKLSVATITLNEMSSIRSRVIETNSLSGSLTGSKVVKFGAKVDTCVLGTICHETLDVEAKVGKEFQVDLGWVGESDSVSYSVASNAITLSTLGGASGRNGDMVLVLSTTSSYLRTREHSMDENTCNVNVVEKMIWTDTRDSMIYMSRRDCEGELSKSQQTVTEASNLLQNQNVELSAEERLQTTMTLLQGSLGIASWTSLLSAWDTDYTEAQNYPVDLTQFGNIKAENLNDNSPSVFTMSTGSVTISENLTDGDTSSEFDAFSAFGSKTLRGYLKQEVASVGVEMELAATSTREFVYATSRDSDTSATTEYSVTFTELDAEDNVAFEVFRSPHSGTLVFKTKGGMTRCPHLEGTSPHEIVEVDMEAATFISEDKGEVKFEISTTGMENFETGEEKSVDLMIELDPVSALFPVAFTIGSATLNQPFQLSNVKAGEKLQGSLFFERQTPDVSQITVTGRVYSKCDSSISSNFIFTAAWKNSCAEMAWYGDLEKPEASWLMTAQNPKLILEVENSNFEEPWKTFDAPAFSVWYILKKTGKIWKELPRDVYEGIEIIAEGTRARTELEISRLTGVIFEGQQYMFELRKRCATEYSFSGPRLGMVDTVGPELFGWKLIDNQLPRTRHVPLMSHMFSEAVECGNITATLTAVNTDLLEPVKLDVLCTGQAHQVSSMMYFEKTSDITDWSGKKVRVAIQGVTDINGNMYEGDNNDGKFTRTFLMPEFATEFADVPPLRFGAIAAASAASVAEARSNRLAPVTLTSFSNKFDGLENDNDGTDTGLIVGISIGAVVAVGAVAAAVVYRMRHPGKPMAKELPEEDQKPLVVDKDAGISTANPAFNKFDI